MDDNRVRVRLVGSGNRRVRWSVMVAAGVATCALLAPRQGNAQHGSPMPQSLFQGCASQINSMPIDARMPLGRNMASLPPRFDNSASAATCQELNWARIKANAVVITAQWKGRTTTVAGDCGHSTFGWGLYRKNGASWTYIGGGFSWGDFQNGQCVYNGINANSLLQQQNWGSFGLNTGQTTTQEYRVAWSAWSHDELGGHGNYCADPTQCQWPIGIRLYNNVGFSKPKQDWTVFRPVDGTWHHSDTTTGAYTSQVWGQSGDIASPGDYDGDYNSDFAIRRWFNGNLQWWVVQSATNTGAAWNWGIPGDAAVPSGDYDGDGRSDLAVFRNSNANWYIVKSNTWTSYNVPFGASGDIPYAANFDDDLKTDLAVWRPSTGVFHRLLSSTGAYLANQWGTSGDIPRDADFDGDGKSDLVVWRPSNGTYYYIRSSDGAGIQVQYGQNGDIPIPLHIDNDHKSDPAIWRPSQGRWYYLLSTTGSHFFTAFGQNGDQPAVPFTRGD